MFRVCIIVLTNTRRRQSLKFEYFVRLSVIRARYDFVTVFIGRLSGGEKFRQKKSEPYGSIVADNEEEEDEAFEIEEV